MKIAFIGKICSGKSTFSEYLKTNHAFTILSFGEPVKRIAKDIFGLESKNRIIIQDFAQKVREIDNDVWVKYLIRRMENTNGNIVIDDLRFPNEYDALKKAGFYFVKLSIDKDLQITRIKNLYKESWKTHIERLDHISESYTNVLAEDYNIKIENDIEIKPIIDSILKSIS